MPNVDSIRAALINHRPRVRSVKGKRHAAVAAVLRPGERAAEIPEILIIRRADREGDPWSGHMAFPGGRHEEGDASPRFTAERETREEVGVDLTGAEYLGRLDDVHAKGSPLVISAFVYLATASELKLREREVREVFWLSLRDLLDPDAHVKYNYPQAGPDWLFPGIGVGEDEQRVIWGLTYGFLEQLLGLVCKRLPSSRPWFRSLPIGEWEDLENREQVAQELVKRIEKTLGADE